MDIETTGQYRALIEQSSDVITVVDGEGVVRFANRSVERVLGYDPEQFVGERVAAYVHPDDRERLADALSAPTDSSDGVVGQVECRFEHADGSWVWLESTVSDPRGVGLDGYVVNSRDVSRRKRHERELAEERNKYATVVERSHDGIAVVDDGEFVFVNARFAEIHGYDDDELVGRSSSDLIVPEDRETVREYDARRLNPSDGAESPPRRHEVRFLTSEGETRVGEASLARIPHEGGSATLVTLRDVTDRHRYEERLEEVSEELEALNRLIRHDIRNDMSVILGWADVLEAHVDDEGRGYLRKLLASGEHVVELTDIARDYVEVLTAGGDVEVTAVPLRSVLETEVELRRESFPEAEFGCEAIPDVEVEANRMLGSVFRNLLGNAVQHNDADDPFVTVDAETDGDWVEVRVADNGPGVPDDRKEEVFGKNEKGLDSSGTGIGLYLVHTLVSEYGGSVRVEDNDPRGAVFVVRLRRAGRAADGSAE